MLLTESAIHRVNSKPTNRRSLCRIPPILRDQDSKTHTNQPRSPEHIVSPDAFSLLIGGKEETDGAP
jgi:hypothetical protein